MLKQILGQEVRAELERQASATLRKREALGPDGDAWSADRICTTAVERVLQSKVAPLTQLQAGCLRAVATGAVWPQGRLSDEGYDVPEMCQLCKQHRDSLWHRPRRFHPGASRQPTEGKVGKGGGRHL